MNVNNIFNQVMEIYVQQKKMVDALLKESVLKLM